MRIDASGTLPAIEDVLAKYIEALGGQDKIRTLKSRVTQGKARVPGEFSDAPFEMSENSPNKAVIVVKPERANALGQAFAGSVGWRQLGLGGARRLKGVELSELQRDCDFYAPLR